MTKLIVRIIKGFSCFYRWLTRISFEPGNGLFKSILFIGVCDFRLLLGSKYYSDNGNNKYTNIISVRSRISVRSDQTTECALLKWSFSEVEQRGGVDRRLCQTARKNILSASVIANPETTSGQSRLSSRRFSVF